MSSEIVFRICTDFSPVCTALFIDLYASELRLVKLLLEFKMVSLSCSFDHLSLVSS